MGVAVGVGAVGAHGQLAPGAARLHIGEQDAVVIGELVGGVGGADDRNIMLFGGHLTLSFMISARIYFRTGILAQFCFKSKALCLFPYKKYRIREDTTQP